MSRPTNAIAALTKVRAAAARGRKPTPANPKRLQWDRIKINESVFQRRGPVVNYQREAFIDELARDLKRQGTAEHLAPVVVWWAGSWLLVDGHHRMAAVHKSLGASAVVPVVVLGGDLEAALAASIALNRKTKLSMARSERLNAAWFLAIHAPGMSQAQVEEAAGVSGGTVNEQRRVLRELRKQWSAADFGSGLRDPEGMTWRDAKAAETGHRLPLWDAEEGQKTAVAAIVRTLTASLGKQIARNPEAVTEALKQINPGWFDNDGDAGDEDDRAAQPVAHHWDHPSGCL